MRAFVVTLMVLIFLAVAGTGAWLASSAFRSGPAVVAVAPEPSETEPAATDAAATAAGAGTPFAGTSPIPAAESSPVQSPSPSPPPSPSPSPTIPAEPTGLAPGWSKQYDRDASGREADLVVRTGDINNLGFGWPKKYTPFSGDSTPRHPWPCTPRPGAAPGTDRVMLGTAVTPLSFKRYPSEGYAHCSSRPDNLPEAIHLTMGALPSKVRMVLFQMFVDDFQPTVMHSHFQVSLNGTRIPTFENSVNQLDQTGPIGKLMTLRLLPEYYPMLATGSVDLLFDDPTTGHPDGYAVDFVRVLVNPHAFPYAVTIACDVVDADTQKAIARASVTAAQVTATTGSAGTVKLTNVPAGLVSVAAEAVGYDGATQLLDLPAGTPGVAHFALHRHRDNVADLKAALQRNGSVAIYGIHFDTASAKLRPDSIASLRQVQQLIDSSPNARWTIAGHTDNQGGAAYNENLSDARAHSVVAWLARHHVDGSKLTAVGYGLTRPVADNATESGRALNRRVEVSLTR